MSKHVSRRTFLKGGAAAVGALAAGVIPRAEAVAAAPQDKAQVFFTPDIGVEGLLKVYARINRGVGGSVAVKLHTGEPHGPNILPPDMVRAFLERRQTPEGGGRGRSSDQLRFHAGAHPF